MNKRTLTLNKNPNELSSNNNSKMEIQLPKYLLDAMYVDANKDNISIQSLTKRLLKQHYNL